jgi:hypothetical protein
MGKEIVRSPEVNRVTAITFWQVSPTYPWRVPGDKLKAADKERHEGILYDPGPDTIQALAVQIRQLTIQRFQDTARTLALIVCPKPSLVGNFQTPLAPRQKGLQAYVRFKALAEDVRQ